MKHIKRIKIDIDKKNFKVIPSVQFDNARFLHINLVNGSMLFDLTGCSVKISGTKPDGTIIFNNCTIINEKEGFIEVELTEQINAVPGIVKCELKLYDGNGVLTTKNFDIEVSASATANGITSSNEFKALTDALKVVQGIDNKADKEKVEEKFGEVYEQLGLKANEDDVVRDRKRNYYNLRRINKKSHFIKFNYPETFSFAHGEVPSLFFNGIKYYTDFDVSQFKHTGGKTVYVSKSGKASNDGLTENTPCQSLEQALILAADGDTICIIDKDFTVFGRGEWIASGAIDKSVNIISKNKIIVFKGSIPSWTKTKNQKNIYEFSRSSVIEIVDMNNIENPIKYVKVTSISELDNTQYAWYTDNSKVYINPGHKHPNDLILPIMETGYPCISNKNDKNIKLYIEGLIFIGGDENVKILGNQIYNEHEFYAKNCKFLFATKYDSVKIHDCLRGYFQNCECGYSAKDGFNYSAPNSRRNPDFIELNCRGYANGDNAKNSPDTHNGSTAHVDCRGVRINGIYNNNFGGNVVDSGTVKSVNLGCMAFDSESVSSNSSQGFGLQTATGEMWLENCIAFGNKNDMFCADGSIIHIKNSQYDTVLGGGNWDCDERL